MFKKYIVEWYVRGQRNTVRVQAVSPAHAKEIARAVRRVPIRARMTASVEALRPRSYFGAPRSYHEDFALSALKKADSALKTALSDNCAQAINGLVESAKAIARMRSHLASISPGARDSKRTMRLFAVVHKREKILDKAVAQVQRSCAIKR